MINRHQFQKQPIIKQHLRQRITSITQFPTAHNQKTLRRFLAIAGLYLKFIQILSSLSLRLLPVFSKRISDRNGVSYWKMDRGFYFSTISIPFWSNIHHKYQRWVWGLFSNRFKMDKKQLTIIFLMLENVMFWRFSDVTDGVTLW